MNSGKSDIINDIFISKDLKYNWHEDPYSYYKLAKEVDLPYNLYEIFSANIIDPQDEEEQKAKSAYYKNNYHSEAKKVVKPKLNIPIIETILLENGQITAWIYNDRKGFVNKKPLKKLGTDYLIHQFLSKVKHYYSDVDNLFSNISDTKILIDLPKFAPYIMQKKENRDEKMFEKNNLGYIDEMKKIKFILIYYYGQKEPLLTDFINFYFLLNEHGGINNIKMIQNCINCKLKNSSLLASLQLKSSFNKADQNVPSNINNNISEDILRQITVKYAKPNELESKRYYVYFEKPKMSSPLYFDGTKSNTNTQNNKSANKYMNKFKSSKKIYINADPKIPNSKNIFKKTYNNDLLDLENPSSSKKLVLESSVNNSAEKSNLKKSNNKNIDTDNNLDDSFEKKKFKYYLKGGKRNDGKIMAHMEKLEENLILQNNDLLNRTLSSLSEKLIKYIEKTKHMFVLYAYFIFIRMNSYDLGEDDFYAFQKCLLLYGIDKNEGPVLEKTYLLRQNMKNIIYKRIPEDVNKFNNFEKYTKNDFCHGEFCSYIVPNYFKGIKEQVFPKFNSKIPKENKISVRGKNKELPGKIPLFEIKKVYDNPELTNLVLKAYSIFPPTFNKEAAIERLIKERNKKLFVNNEDNARNNNNNDDEESKKNIEDIADEFGPIMDSSEKISDKIQEYEKEFKQEIIVYRPTPGKFLHVDYNDMYTEKGVCEKCYKIYTIILEFMRNIDECTAEFKDLIKAKQFLIKGENLRVNNFEDKNSNDNNLIIQEELGKMSVKKFLGIKILKLRLEELNKFKKKQRSRIDRNLVTHKQELNKTFNYNMHINLRLLLANLLAEKTNNQFFNVLFNEIYNEDDTIFKHLDIKKPKIIFEKTNMKDLRLQMGISSLAYNPNFISKKKVGDKNTYYIQNMIKNNIEKQKNNQILKNIQQQICQVDKNLFQEYSILCGFDKENNNNSDEEVSYEKDKDLVSETSEKNNGKQDKTKIIDDIFEYFRIPTLSRIRFSSLHKKKSDSNTYKLVNIRNSHYLVRNNSVKNKETNLLLKLHKIKKSARRKEKSKNVVKKEVKKMYNFIPIKSLEEIKKEKEKQLEEFLKFDPKKIRRKNVNNNKNNDKKNDKDNKDDSNSIKESENMSQQSNNPFALLFEDENWEYCDSQENSSDIDISKWDKDKVILFSLFYNKTTKEFQECNSTPYFYITTPFPKLKDFNSTQRINENPLDMLRKMNSEQFSSLGNFMEENLEEENKDSEKEKTKYLLNSKDVKIYAHDKYTAIPYEILDYNSSDKYKDSNRNKSRRSNINNNRKKDESKKYIVFVINDFFDTYEKYRYYFNLVLMKLKCFQTLSKDSVFNTNEIKKKKNAKLPINNLLIRNRFNIINKTSKVDDNNNNNNININIEDNKMKNDTNSNRRESKRDNITNEDKKEYISELKFVLFNLPGQSTTFFSKEVIQNNIYYSDFLDKFIYFLYKEKEFDISYKIVLLGFGNGGHIALTYASLYEKYWNILDSIIMFNAYCRNGPIVNEAMLEVLKLVTKENNPKTIEFFIKQSTRNPKEFSSKENESTTKKTKKEKSRPNIKNFYGMDDEYLELQKKMRKMNVLTEDKNKFKKENKSYNKANYKLKKFNNIIMDENDDLNINLDNGSENIENNITLEGYKTITKGYFYNIQLNLNEISTKILCIHSNVDSFINIHNISPLFDNDIASYHSTPLKELFSFYFKNKNEDNNSNKVNLNYIISDSKNEKSIGSNKDKINSFMGYNLGEFKTKESNARKLIIFDGSHDVSHSLNNKENIICTTLISYFN